MSEYNDMYFENLKLNFDEGLELMRNKNHDYAGDQDPFKNFRDSAIIAGVTVEQGLLVRIADKLARYRNLNAENNDVGKVGEKITDTLLDAMNYLNILKTWEDLGRPEGNFAPQTEEEVSNEIILNELPEKTPGAKILEYLKSLKTSN